MVSFGGAGCGFCGCRARKASCILRPVIVEEVALSSIDFKDETFRISEDLDLARMKASLQAIGLIHPVVLIGGATPDVYRIVCGFRRLYGLRGVGAAEASARILQADEFNKLEVLLKAVWDNLSHRKLTPLEAARTLFKLKHECGVADDLLTEQFLPLLGLASHRNVLRSYLNLHCLHPDLRSLFTAGHLTLSSAGRLAQATPETQAGVASVLGKVRLSASLQREVLELAEDLAAIYHFSLVEVLDAPEIRAVADDAGLSPFQKGEKIHACLYQRRNPRLSRTHEMFLAEKSKLSLPGTVRLAPDPFFETPRLRVEFDADSAWAFREAVEALERACRTDSLDRLFKI